jgi:hypothetical protein
MIHPDLCPSKLVIIAQELPCWLALALAMRLPLAAVFISKEMRAFYSARDYITLSSINDIWEVPPDWNTCTVLALGLYEHLNFILTKLRYHEAPFMYATDTVFKGWRPQDMESLLNASIDLHHQQGLALCVVRHVNFGGVTSGFQIAKSWRVDMTAFRPTPALPRILAHILNAATPDLSREIEPPYPIDEPIPCSPIVRDGMLRQEGLSDIFWPTLHIACPCIFKASGWAQHTLSAKEILRAFNTPLNMDEILLTDRRARGILQCSITLIVDSAIFRLLWSGHGGG